MAAGESDQAEARLRTLAGYLQLDPDNLQLLADMAEAAFAAGALEEAKGYLHRYETLQALPPPPLNLKGLIALGQQRWDEAAAIFSGLLAQGHDDPRIAFNLAWAKAMVRDHEGALALLDERVMATAPAAATLRIQTLHHLGRLEDALKEGGELAKRLPSDTSLMAALSIVAMDADNKDLARSYALKAGDRADSLATLGMLSLDEDHVQDAGQLFDRALAISPDGARALLGKGLELMLEGRPQPAAERMDRAAELFVSHIGSWVAAGWAHVIAGDRTAGRARFERALALDDRFAETHGALAVLDVIEGRLEEGRRRAEVALRLDRSCLSAALANILLLNQAGRGEAAERILSAALNRPLDDSGRTIAQSMVRLGLGSKGTPKAG